MQYDISRPISLSHLMFRGVCLDNWKSSSARLKMGFWYWFTFVIHLGVEPTNNRAERALREHVVQRKIVGTLRNGKGTSIHERIMTVLATWVQQGLGQSPDDEGEAERLNTYRNLNMK
jgi:hypothetical protein